MKKLNLVLLILGLGFLGYLVWQVGPREFGREVMALGWGVIPLIVGEGLANLAHTLGWRHCLNRKSPSVPLLRLFRMAMAGFAINYLLPTASVGGEASRAALLASTRPASEAFSSVLVDKLMTAIAHLVLAVLGAVFVLWYAPLPSQIWLPMAVTTMLLAGGMGTFLLVQRHGKLGALLRWLTDRGLGGDWLLRVNGQIAGVDAALKRFYRDQPWDLFFSMGWHLIGHSFALLHAWWFLWLLGYPASLGKVACAGFVSLWCDLLTFAIPLNLGGLEGSRILALKAIGNNAAAGMGFGVSLRITYIFWACFGLINSALFSVRKARQRGSTSPGTLPAQSDPSVS